MTQQSLDTLFDEFAARWARGDHPDVTDFLDRAGAEREKLAELLDRYIAAAAVPAPSAETVATFDRLVPRGEEPSPMLEVRVQMGLGLRQVVRRLCFGLGLGSEAEEKVAGYYSKLETARLDPRRVSPHVWHTLATVLGTGIRSLMTDRYGPPPVFVTAFTQQEARTAAMELSFRVAARRSYSLQESSEPLFSLDEGTDAALIRASSESPPAPSRDELTPEPKPELDEIDRLFLGGS